MLTGAGEEKIYREDTGNTTFHRFFTEGDQYGVWRTGSNTRMINYVIREDSVIRLK